MLLRGMTVFAFAGASIAFVPPNRDVDRDAVLPLTAGAVHGRIEVVSFGVAEIRADDGKPFAALHVRETFTNEADSSPWTIELAATTAFVADAQELHPTLVNSDTSSLPILLVGRGQRRTADLYFALPAKLALGEPIDAFTVRYRLNTADHKFAARVALARAPWMAYPSGLGPAPGWGRAWWADPTYAWPTYNHRGGPLTPRAPTSIVIVRAPRAYYAEQLPDVAAGDDDWPRSDECDEW
jgi:hypothetical protein